MKRTEFALEAGALPEAVRPFLRGAAVYDCSSSEQAQTLLIEGGERVFLKISQRGSLEREYRMAGFLHQHNLAPQALAYVSDTEHDYLLLAAVDGEDGTAAGHLAHPRKLAAVYGEYLRMLHTLPTAGCPYGNRTRELLRDAEEKGADLGALKRYGYSAADNVVLHGDYCLPNLIMDRFAFRGFIDLGHGGVGDRHCDIYWGLWSLQYNLKTDGYNGMFLDTYGRSDIDADGLRYFGLLAELAD